MSKTLTQQIIFDLDDTLVHCNRYFDQILDEFAALLSGWFANTRITAQEIRAKQIEIDVAGVEQIGFISTHFPHSLIETYRYFSQLLGLDAGLAEEQKLMKLGMSVYDKEIEAYPNMTQTLNLLRSQGHQLHLYTGGESVIQQRKIDQMRLTDYFEERIYIRRHKNVDALEEILSAGPFDRSHTWMIGNSLRTDIMPALSAGIHSIYIKRPNEWSFNLVELKHDAHSEMFTISALEEIPSVIASKLSLSSFSEVKHLAAGSK